MFATSIYAPLRRGVILLLLITMQMITACTADSTDELPPYATSETLTQPRIFARDVVSTELPEFASAFSPDGKTVFFNRMPADRSRIDMMISRYEDGAWRPAELLPFSGEHNDVDPYVSSDGSRLYFSSNRPADGGREAGNWDTWYVDIDGKDFGDPVRLGSAVNTEATEIFISLTDDGTLYFRRSTDDMRGIFKAAADGDGFATPLELHGLDLESPGNPLIARDGSFLILSSNDPDRAGELVISFPDGDRWTPAQNMGNVVNSIYADFAPGLSPDGRYLFFTSERPGIVSETAEGRPPGDIYQIELRSIEGIDWPD